MTTLTTADRFVDLNPEGPYYYKPDRATPIQPHFEGYYQLNESDRGRVNEVAQGRVEQYVVRLPGEEILIEHKGTGSVVDDTTQQRLGYTIRRRPVPEGEDLPHPGEYETRGGGGQDAELTRQLEAAQADLQRIRIERDLAKLEAEKSRQELARTQSDGQEALQKLEVEHRQLQVLNQKLQGDLKKATEVVAKLEAAGRASKTGTDPAAVRNLERQLAEREQKSKEQIEAIRAKAEAELAECKRELAQQAQERERELTVKLQAAARVEVDKLRLATKELNREKLRLEQQVQDLTAKLESQEEVWRPAARAPQAVVESPPTDAHNSATHAVIIWIVTLILVGLCVYLWTHS